MKIIKVVCEEGDYTFWFDDSEEPWNVREFYPDSPVRQRLEAITELMEDEIG